MTRKICLRCDWEGDTQEPACPDCGERPLYVVGPSPSQGADPVRSREVPEQPQTEPTIIESAPPEDALRAEEEEEEEATSRETAAGRSPRVAVAVVTALVLILAIGTWSKLRGGSPHAETAPGPSTSQQTSIGGVIPSPAGGERLNSLVQIDATSGVILDRVRVPTPRLVAVDGGSVWVYSQSDRTRSTLIRIDQATNTATRTFDAPGNMTTIAAVGGGVWLGDQHGGLYRLDRGTDTFLPGLDEAAALDPPNYLGDSLLAAAGSLWVSWFPPGPCCHPPPDLYRIDPASGGVIAKIDGGGVAAAYSDGFVLTLGAGRRAASADTIELARVDTSTYATQRTGTLSVPWDDLMAADGDIWTASPDGNAITRLDPQAVDFSQIRVGGPADALTSGGGAVWAAIGEKGIVVRYDLETERITTIDIGGTPTDVVFDDGSVWVVASGPVAVEAPPSTAALDAGERLGVGRHSLTVAGVPFSFRVPTSGWQGFGDLFIGTSTTGSRAAEAIIYWTTIDRGVDARPCGQWWGSAEGSTSDWAASASTTRGTDLVAGPTSTTIDGYPAQLVVFTVSGDVACQPGFFYTWRDPPGGPSWAGIDVGDTVRIWLVQTDTEVLYIEADTHSDAGPRVSREIQEIMRSIRFD